MLLSPSMGALLFTAGRTAGPAARSRSSVEAADLADRLPLPRTGSGVLLPGVSGSLGGAGRASYDEGEHPCGHPPVERLAAKTQPLDERAVAVDVGLLQVLQQAATAPHEREQTTTGVVVVLVQLEVLGQVGDALGEHRDLDLWRTGVAFDRGV